MSNEKIIERAKEILKSEAVIICAADIREGVMEQVQLYFESDGEAVMDVTHDYPDLTVHLTLYSAVIAEGEPKKLEHNDIRWITPREIPNYAFCPADVEILREICRQAEL